MNLLRQAVTIARIEGAFFLRYPKLLLASAIVVLIPALYALIYLASVWDTAAHTNALSVGVVNHDKGMKYQEQQFNIGNDVVARLKLSGRFGFKEIADEAEARRLVRQGKFAFALIIPSQFSAKAIPGNLAGAGQPVVYVSEGNNYESAAMAAHFADLLGEQINESLNEKRWAMVLNSAVGSQQSVDRLRTGVQQLHKSAKELSSGAKQTAEGAQTLIAGGTQLTAGVGQLSTGVKQLGNNLRLLDSRRPSNTELNQLKTGAEQLAAGHQSLDQGMLELKSGTRQLQKGVQQFQDAVEESAFAPATLVEGLNTLGHGVSQLDVGLNAASSAQATLSEGAAQLSEGVDKLTGGVRRYGSSIHTIVTKLPLNSELDQLSSGASVLHANNEKVADATLRVAKGAQLLTVGINQIARSLPTTVSKPDGSPEGLARSVDAVVERSAPVKNSGSGFAPNVIPAALWLGAGIVAFLLHVRVLPLEARSFSPPIQLIGKIFFPSCLALLQALLVMAIVIYVLGIDIVNVPAFALTLCVASISFLLITFALTRAFGDAGKALAMVLLAVQLSSSSGILPVELSGKLFVDISPWLPITWVVKALKATMFGAYDGVWQTPLLKASVSGMLAFLMACTIGKWRFACASTTRPAVDL